MFWNRVAVMKLLAVGRALVAQAYRGRTFVKVDHAVFDRFSAALDQVTGQQPVGARETAELIVRDFIAANRIDDDAQAALANWIVDAIYLTTLDFSEMAENLRHAAQRVIDNWELGDLAGAVRDLSALLRQDEAACEYCARGVPMSANAPTMHDTGAVLAPCAAGGQ